MAARKKLGDDVWKDTEPMISGKILNFFVVFVTTVLLEERARTFQDA